MFCKLWKLKNQGFYFFTNFKSYYKKKGVIYWSLLHSQRWCVRDIWYFLTTLQLVCFRMRYDYHFYHRHRFRKKQQITIFFALLKQPHNSTFFLRQYLPVKHFLISSVKSSNCDSLSLKKSCSDQKTRGKFLAITYA